MTRFILSLLFAFASLLSIGADNLAKYELNVGEFTKLKISGNVDIVYRNNPDSVGMVAYTASPRHAEAFAFSLKKETLRITLEQEWEAGMPVVYVYSSFLSSVENEADGTLTVFSPAPCPSFDVRLIGNGKIVVDNINSTSMSASLLTGKGNIAVTGATKDVSASMMGAGSIDLSCLSATDVSCKSIGTGWISCWARKKLNVKGIGSTRIYYRGDPEINKIGGAKILPISEQPKQSFPLD